MLDILGAFLASAFNLIAQLLFDLGAELTHKLSVRRAKRKR
jgi:hypothetical protein